MARSLRSRASVAACSFGLALSAFLNIEEKNPPIFDLDSSFTLGGTLKGFFSRSVDLLRDLKDSPASRNTFVIEDLLPLPGFSIESIGVSGLDTSDGLLNKF